MNDWLDAEGHADRALDWFERGRWADAESELRKAIALNPDRAEWHFNLALTLEADGRDPEALACYEHAVTLMPGQIEPLLAAGIVCNRLGQHRRALEHFQQVLGLDRAIDTAYSHSMESHLRLGDHDEVETSFYLAQHELADPSAPCYALLAESLMQRSDWARAEWCLKEALRLDANMPRLRARLGAVLAATGRPQRALQMYLRDLRDDPGNVDTLLDYGELLLDMGRLPDASEKFRRVLELEPANVDAHHRLGRIAMQARRFEPAHLEYELVLKLDADYPEIRLDVAEALLRRSRRRDARPHLQEELERYRATVEPGESDDRRDDLGARYHERFGSLLLDVGWPAQAATLLERAVELGREEPETYRRLALACFRSGNSDQGIAASRRVARLDRTCIRSVHNLALAALGAGRHQIAAGWIARGLQINRHDVGIRRLRMQLWSAIVRRRIRRWLRLKDTVGSIAAR